MVAARRGAAHRPNTSISLRAPASITEMIDCAARLLGKSRSAFILDSARKCAEDVLLDQRFFMLDEKHYAAFLERLSEPSRPTTQLRKLLASKFPWEK